LPVVWKWSLDTSLPIGRVSQYTSCSGQCQNDCKAMNQLLTQTFRDATFCSPQP